jgi:hypothetical protein
VVGHDVLVWIDAPLFVDSLAASPSVRLADLHGRDSRPDGVMAMHVIAIAGDVLEVEPTRGCSDHELGGVEHAHFFVHRDDLAQVVTAPYDHAFADGSRVRIAAGAAVSVRGRGEVAVVIAAHVMFLTLPDLAVGWSYAGPPVRFDGTVDGALAPQTAFSLAGSPQRSGLGANGWVGQVTPGRRGSSLLVVASGCTSVAIRVPPTAIADTWGDGTGWGTMGIGVDCRDRYWLPAHTPITVEGRARGFGATTNDLELAGAPAIGAADACGSLTIWLDGNEQTADDQRTLRVCAPMRAMHHTTPSPSCTHGSRPAK